jgi:hypothetical protein
LTSSAPRSPEGLYELGARRDGSAVSAVTEAAREAREAGDEALGELLGALDARRLGLEASVVLLATARPRAAYIAPHYEAFFATFEGALRQRMPAHAEEILRVLSPPANRP